MCNAYRVTRKDSAENLAKTVSDEIARLPSNLVRRTGRGVVVTKDEGGMVVSTMRWGFSRPFSDSINNTRSDNFDSPVWKEALAKRRCLVPISSFYLKWLNSTLYTHCKCNPEKHFTTPPGNHGCLGSR